MAKRKRLDGKLVFITGGGRGIGAACAAELARAGARVAIGELDASLANDGVRAVRDAGGSGSGYVLDVTHRDQFDQVIDQAEKDNGPIDVLINNAGIMALGAFVEHGRREDDRQLEVNLRGVMNGMRAILPRMIHRNSGHIVNIASVAGRVGAPFAAVYSATKFAVVGLTEAVRGELIDTNIDFTYVMPSLVDTELIAGAGRPVWPPVLSPQDVAKATRRGIERRQVDVFVPRVARMSVVLPVLLPRSVLDWMGRRLNVADMFSQVDRAQRSAYVARTLVNDRPVAAEPGKGTNGRSARAN